MKVPQKVFDGLGSSKLSDLVIAQSNIL